jgi:hypothetical protein
MNKYLLLIGLPALLLSCDAKRKDKIADDSKLEAAKAKKDSLQQVAKMQEHDDAMQKPTTVQIIDSLFDFGTKTEGEKVEYSYRFKNTGTNPLFIFTATSTCGCTVPEVPEAPIMPGEIGFIKVVFNTEHKSGQQEKPINVTSNANPAFPVLHLQGNVVKP